MTYGVLPSGFNRKPLPVILAEIEQSNIDTFGEGIIQTSQSPLGQLNGVFSDVVSDLWELAAAIYSAWDPDQAEGYQLENLGRIRLLERATGEADPAYRQAITNAGRARIDVQDLRRALTNLSGVYYVRVFVNDDDATDANGLDAHSVSVAVLGGTDEEIGEVVRDYVVPGIGTSGNTRVDVSSDGYCRTIFFSRPVPVPIKLALTVRKFFDRMDCPPPSLEAIEQGAIVQLMGNDRPINGQDVTSFVVRSAIEAYYPQVVEVVSITGARGADPLGALPIAIAFDEIAEFTLANIDVTNAP